MEDPNAVALRCNARLIRSTSVTRNLTYSAMFLLGTADFSQCEFSLALPSDSLSFFSLDSRAHFVRVPLEIHYLAGWLVFFALNTVAIR